MSESDFKNPNEERLIYFDNIKGFLIFLTVFGYFLFYSSRYFPCILLLTLIFSFNTASFAFISGYLTKSEHSRSSHSV